MNPSRSSVDRLPDQIRRMLRSEFVRHSALLFAATMLSNALNYGFSFVVSRRLGPENFATLSSLSNGLMILSFPASITNLLVVKYAAEFHALGDRARLWALSQTLLRFTSVSAGAIFCAGIALRGTVASFLHIPQDSTIPLAAAILAISFITPSARGVLQGQQDFGRFSTSVVIEVFVKAICGIWLVYASYGVVGALVGWLCGTALALGYTLYAVRRNRVPFGREKIAIDARKLLRTIGGVTGATGALAVLSFVDMVLVKHYFDPHDAGVYAAVNLTGKIVLFIVSFLPIILLPKAIAMVQNMQSPSKLLLRAAVGTACLCGGVLVIFGHYPGLIIRAVAGRAFIDAAPYVLQYDLAMGFLAGITLVVNYKIAIHRFGFVYPLGAVAVAEIAAIGLWHQTLWQVVHVLLLGNLVALVACLYRVNSPTGAAPAARSPEA